MILAIGCCLYLGTGMLLGAPFYTLLARLSEGRPVWVRFAVATALAAAMWFVNFYLLLSWIQPALIGGRWITDPKILPPWVALVTHLVFGWTLAAALQLGNVPPLPGAGDGDRGSRLTLSAWSVPGPVPLPFPLPLSS